MAAGLRLAACAVAFHLCLLISSSASLRWLPDKAVVSTAGRDRTRTGYHFQPAKNWQNDPNVQPAGRDLGPRQPLLGAFCLPRPRELGRPRHRARPHRPLRRQGLLVRLRHTSPRRRPGLVVHRRRHRRHAGAERRLRQDPADPLLREWVKPAYNPVIPHPADVLFSQFRDPSTAWVGSDDLWRVAIAAQVVGNTGAATLVYRSKDFRRWKRNTSPLYASRAAGMVECPDLFPVAEPGMEEGRLDYTTGTASGAVRHVLKLSVMNTTQDYYAVGRYDDVADTFTPEVDGERIVEDCRTWRRFDYGHMYASKSFFDARKNRRVLWAWANESDSQDDDIARGWSGLQTVPRKVWLDGDGKQLRQWPIEEIETLRSKRVGRQLVGLHVNTGGVKEITGAGAQADVEAVFQIPALEGAETFEPKWLLDPQKLCGERGVSVPGGVGPFGLLVMASGDLREHTSVFFRVFRHSHKYKILMCTDLTRSTRRDKVYKPAYGGFVDMDMEEQGRTISLRTLIDHSVLESFGGGGRTCMTARVYPEHAEKSKSHVFVFNNGTSAVKLSKLDAWRLKTAVMPGR